MQKVGKGGSSKWDKHRGQEKKLDLDDPCGFLPAWGIL